MPEWWEEYLRPHTVAEALEALSNAPQPACPIAGGTDLVLDLQQGRHAPVRTLVDLTGITEMNALEVRRAELFIGAAVPLSRVAASKLVEFHALALVEACSLIGGPQVRNTASLGGNVAHALPAADGTIALLALNAQAEVASPEGCRRVPLAQLFLGPGKSALVNGFDLLVGFYLPLLKTGKASAFKRVMRAQGVALPILNLAAWVEREQGRINQAHIAIGPSGQIPFRARTTEAFLQGKIFEAGLIEDATTSMLSETSFRSSPQRASAEYRRRLAGWLLSQTFATAWGRAG
jgi:xanthine dehydrogenase FAD-binding subunit